MRCTSLLAAKVRSIAVKCKVGAEITNEDCSKRQWGWFLDVAVIDPFVPLLVQMCPEETQDLLLRSELPQQDQY